MDHTLGIYKPKNLSSLDLDQKMLPINESTNMRSFKKLDGISVNSAQNLKYIEEIFSEGDMAWASQKQENGSSQGETPANTK
jgi:hypothetical protein